MMAFDAFSLLAGYQEWDTARSRRSETMAGTQAIPASEATSGLDVKKYDRVVVAEAVQVTEANWKVVERWLGFMPAETCSVLGYWAVKDPARESRLIDDVCFRERYAYKPHVPDPVLADLLAACEAVLLLLLKADDPDHPLDPLAEGFHKELRGMLRGPIAHAKKAQEESR